MRFVLDSIIASVGLMFGTRLLHTPEQDWGIVVLVLSAVLLGIVSTRADSLEHYRERVKNVIQMYIPCQENGCKRRGLNYCLGCTGHFCDAHTDMAGWCLYCATRPDLEEVGND